jgi:glycogen(starch) synthase
MPIQSILMTADTVGGVWTYALEISEALGEYNIHITLATMGAPVTPQQQETAAKIKNLDIIEGKNEQGDLFKLEWMESPWKDVQKAGEWLLDLEAKLKPDLVHLNGYTHGALPWKSPVLMVGHSCVLSWWEAVKGESAPGEWSHYREEVKRGLQAANQVIAPTQAMLDALEKHYGRLQHKMVIPNGCRVEAFDPNFPSSQGGIKGGSPEFIFTAGRVWDEAKNIVTLIAIAPSLLYPVYIAGDNKEPQKELETTPKLWDDPPLTPLTKGGRSAKVPLAPLIKGDLEKSHCLGRLSKEEMQEWYAKAAIYALPAKYEPFGLSVLEAALSGCALVLGDIPSLRENWESVAIFVQPDDHEGLKNAINDLCENPEKCKDLARKSRNRALEFTSQRMAEGYLDAYRSLISNSVA